METMAALNAALLAVMDALLGWSLRISMGFALVLIALGTSLLLTFTRLLTTDQPKLKRCKQDKRQLRSLFREAKAAGNKEALARYRKTMGMIGMVSLKAEAKPLLASLLPIVLIAVWAFARLAYLPPHEGETIPVKATFSSQAIGTLAFIVPLEGLDCESGWVRNVLEEAPDALLQASRGAAVWNVTARQKRKPYVLELRQGGTSVTKDLLVDGNRYAAPLEIYPLEIYPDSGAFESVELLLTPYRPFGLIPGIAAINFDPWLVAYLVIAIPFVFLLRHVFDIN